jgi:hypothetical protein
MASSETPRTPSGGLLCHTHRLVYRSVQEVLLELTQQAWAVDPEHGALVSAGWRDQKTPHLRVHACNVLHVLLDGDNVYVARPDHARRLSISRADVSRIYHTKIQTIKHIVSYVQMEIRTRMHRVLGEIDKRVAVELRPDKAYRIYWGETDHTRTVDVPAHLTGSGIQIEDAATGTERPIQEDVHTHLTKLVSHAFQDYPDHGITISTPVPPNEKSKTTIWCDNIKYEASFSRFVAAIGGTQVSAVCADVATIDRHLRPSDFSRFKTLEFVRRGQHHVEYALYSNANQRLVRVRIETEFTIALCFMTNYSTIKRLDRWEAYMKHPNFRTYLHNPRNRTRAQNALSDRVPDQVLTVYVNIEAVDAEGELYRTARKDPSNFAFVLLSDTTIPMVSPEVLYERLKEIWRLTEESNLQDSFIGLADYQNDSKNSYLSEFITTEHVDLLQTLRTDTYKIPSKDDTEKHIRSLMPSKILSVRGADEFITMVDEVLFMKLFEKQLHFAADVPLHDLGRTTGPLNDIIQPASSPDEGTFLMWCNYISSTQDRNLFFLLIEPGFTYWDFDPAKNQIRQLASLANPNASEYGNDYNPTTLDLCAEDVWFARKVYRHTVIPHKGTLCQRNSRRIRMLTKATSMLSEHVDAYELVYEPQCPNGMQARTNMRCILQCTHESLFTEDCISDTGQQPRVYPNTPYNRRQKRTGMIV